MSTKELSRAELVEQAFDCCMQAVRSYGSPIDESTRAGLVYVMEHFKQLGLRDIAKENEANG